MQIKRILLIILVLLMITTVLIVIKAKNTEVHTDGTFVQNLNDRGHFEQVQIAFGARLQILQAKLIPPPMNEFCYLDGFMTVEKWG